MSIPTIALFASPTSSICSPVHHSCTTGSSDYDFNQRPSSSSPSSSSSSSSPLPSSSPIPKKSIIGGLSRLFSSPSPSVHLSSTFPGSDDTVSLRHDRSDDFGCPYSFSLQKSRDNSPVSVFHGPMSWNTSTTVATAISVGSPSSHKPSVHEFRPGRDRLLHGFVRNALGSCLDYDTVPSSVPDEEELTFDMDDGFIEEEDRDCSTPQAREILLAAQSRHKIFYEDFVTKAFYEAEKAHRGQMRVNGDPYLQHCVETAILLADIGANSTVVAAGILHDTIDDSSMNYNDIFLLFGAGVADLVEEVSKLSQLSKLARDNNTADRIVEADRLHTMFLAMADARAVLIKLADRLHNMMTLDALPIPKQQRFAKETLEIFTPLANRLGIFSWKERLENLCFKHLNPEQHCELSSELDKTFDEAMIVSSKESLEHALDAAEVSFHALYGRHKCLYSIYSKMLKKKLTMKEIHDIHGLRLIVEKESDCYKALDIVHGLWPEVKGRFKDYIENPKLNGYQSLHTVVMSADMVPLEIQIRTKDMHLQAEFGFASHWRYKEYDSKHPLFILQMVEWARWVLTWHCETMNRICYPWGEFGETDFITTPPCPFPLHSKDCPFSYTQQGDHDGPVFVILMENEKMRIEEFPAHSTLKDLLERVGDGSYQCTAFSLPLKEELRLILNHEMVTDFEQTLKMGDVVQLIPSIPDRYLTEYREEIQRMYNQELAHLG